ncbi:MAG: UDP-N-acetylmuramoyl-L-alanyl-D-glutamate--2,6-diaminopimelate ligase [candidate division WOR-3 bacterium]|nr:UDP-N-acetylmuramoyl-L-alanyl-D-glutamate--2,6-diaminopimelate ligase [candidate division WOR-3 bacterium]
MKLADLIKDCKDVKLHGSGEAEITSVAYDSRRVEKDSLYVAIPGARFDGRHFVPDAMARGAAAVAVQSIEGLPLTVPLVEVENARRFLAQASARIAGYPDREMTVIGVTGTNGKTTVTYLLESILKAAGQKTAVIGTTGFYDGERWEKLSHTTPESTDLWQMLAQVKDAGCEAVAIEISSHAIAFERVWGLDVDTAIFTNLTQDHLDFHKDMESYKETKFRLFNEIKKEAVAVINKDDPAGRELAERIKDRTTISYSCKDRNPSKADLWMEIEETSLAGSALVIHCQGLALPVFIHLPGLHNISNLAAASAAALSLGIEPEHLKEGIESLNSVPGRMEPVSNDRGFFIFIDYAHTPDALKHLILAVKELAKGRVVTLFGCGGDRDKDKRPKMGKIASELSDYVFITSDNPRTENPQAIIQGILMGVQTPARRVIVDRREAIFEAVRFLKPGDVLLVAGKGHEDYQILGTEKIHFDDREVVKEALDALT